MEYKSSPVAIGATGAGAIEEHRGVVRGLLSTYDNLDLGGDIVEKGAFAETLRTSGNRRVMLWQHKQEEPLGIGELRDTSRGLEVEVTLNKSIQRAAEALELAKMGALAFSIGYTVKSKRGGMSGPRYLEAVDLKEGSFVTFPMNPAAKILSAKEWAAAAEEAKAVEELQKLATSMRETTRGWRREKLCDLSTAVHARQMKAIASRDTVLDVSLEALTERIHAAQERNADIGGTDLWPEIKAIEERFKYLDRRAA